MLKHDVERLDNVDAALLEDLVAANHILYNHGIVDGFGHVSARHDKHADRFLISCSKAPAIVTAEDILQLDLDGETLADARRSYLERFIHAAIYRARPDVMGIVHSHSPAVIPYGIVAGVSLRCVCHMSGFLARGTPVFEIRQAFGDATDMLIRDNERADALVAALGAASVVLMRGHGSTVVGGTLRQSVFHAVYTEHNARLQTEATKLGPICYLTEAEAAAAAATNAGQIDRAWTIWQMEADRSRHVATAS